MAKIIINDGEYSLYDFDNEYELEKAVIQNQQYLFGKDTIYIDIKKQIGRGSHKGIPDAFLIDFYDPEKPQLYIVENEIASHDVYSHISEQIARFATSTLTSANQIRDILIKSIKMDSVISFELETYLKHSNFKTVTELMYRLTEDDIKIVIVINDASTDLNHAVKIFRSPPDIVLLQRYRCDDKISYYYEPMREEVEDIEKAKNKKGKLVEFNTVVCAALKDGFQHAYMENDAWWAIRLSQEAREKLKYLAIYEKAPVAHVKHYAEIERIEPYKDTGKYILYLKNKKTLTPITLSKTKKIEAPQSPRYTTLSKLLSAKTVSDLWE